MNTITEKYDGLPRYKAGIPVSLGNLDDDGHCMVSHPKSLEDISGIIGVEFVIDDDRAKIVSLVLFSNDGNTFSPPDGTTEFMEEQLQDELMKAAVQMATIEKRASSVN